MESFDVLVIILSIFLAVFLLLGILVLIKVLQIMKQAKAIADSAEEAVENVKMATGRVVSAASAVSITKAIGNVVQLFNKGKK